MTNDDFNPQEYGENFHFEDHSDYEELVRITKRFLRIMLFFIVTIALLCAVLCLAGCKSTEYIEVPVIHTDTLIQTKVQRDSIWKHDSIFVNQWQKGDTIFREKDRWHTKYVESVKHDTVYVAKRDTITKTINLRQAQGTTKKETDTLTWWQQTRIKFANIMIYFAILALVIWLAKKKLHL